MPKITSNRLPKYRKHRASGQAVVTLDGRDFYLGKYGTKASQAAYDRLVGEWVANSRRLSAQNGQTDLTVNELLLAYWRHARQYYQRPDRTQSCELRDIRLSLRPLKVFYGDTPAAVFGPLALKTVREKMIKAGWCRRVVNQRIGRIKRTFKWAVANELVPAEVFHALQAVEGLRRGRSEAHETEPVRPVPDIFVEPVLPYVSRQIGAMIRLQRVTGMRPGEVCIMRACDLDTTGNVWLYQPASHKTAHHGHRRVVCLGPRAQEIVKPFLTTRLEDYLFRPEDAEASHTQERRRQRKTPLWPSHVKHQAKKRRRRRRRKFHDRYDGSSLGRYTEVR